MAKYRTPAKISMDVYEKKRKYFASIILADSKYAPGPAGSRD